MKISNYDFLKRFNKPVKSTKKQVDVKIISAIPRKKKNGDDIIFIKAIPLKNPEQEINFTYDPKFATGIQILASKNQVKIIFSQKTCLNPSTGEEITYNNISKIEKLPDDPEHFEDEDVMFLNQQIDNVNDIYAF